MKSFLHDGGRIVEIVAAADAAERVGARWLAFFDAEEALAWLRRFRGEPLDMLTLRRLLAADSHDVARRGDDDVLRAVAHQLARGRLRLSVAASWGEARAGGGATTAAPAAAPPSDTERDDGADAPRGSAPPVQRGPTREPPLDWIELRVLDDETGAPVRGVELCIALPDGSVRRHVTNAGGLVRVADLHPGTVELQRMIDAEGYEVRRVE